MNCKLLLSTILLSSSFFANAQYGGQTYAITGSATGDYSWNNIRQVNIITGKVSNTILSNGEKQSAGDLIAAAAFDVHTNKLFYSTMHTGQLRWVDLATKTVSVQQQEFVSSTDVTDESINVTRMCIGPDGNGYALTNDANHLYRFTTGNKPVVTDLGNLVDADANNGLSIHNKCSSWGGDMVADVYGKLYIITAGHNVFTVDVTSRIATYIGSITGLPGTYSTNAAVVDDNGDIVVNGSASTQGYYKVKLSDLSATKIEGSDKTYSVSDLANGNFLLQKEANAAVAGKINPFNGIGHIYPNPTTNSVFNVSFDGLKTGDYLITITDLSGKAILSKSVTVGIAGQVETVTAPGLTVGLYLVKVSGINNQEGFTDKIIIN